MFLYNKNTFNNVEWQILQRKTSAPAHRKLPAATDLTLSEMLSLLCIVSLLKIKQSNVWHKSHKGTIH